MAKMDFLRSSYQLVAGIYHFQFVNFSSKLAHTSLKLTNIWPNLPKSATDWTPSVKSYASLGIFFVRQGQTRAMRAPCLPTGTQQIQNLLITRLFITYNIKPKIAQKGLSWPMLSPSYFPFMLLLALVKLKFASVKPDRPCYLA